MSPIQLCTVSKAALVRRPSNTKRLHHLLIVNFVPIVKPPSILGTVTAPLTLTDTEKQGLERSAWFISQGHAYAEEHATKPATIGFALASSPVALLAW
jgi:hypothetical protein